MKRGWIFVLCLFLVLVLFSSFISAGLFSRFTGMVIEGIECTDTDGGNNVIEMGTTTWGPIGGNYYDANDRCSADNQVLSERYCYYSSSLKGYYSGVNYYSCFHGCVNGACILSEGESAICTDTDGGRDYYNKGTVESTITKGGTDYCEEDFVNEYYCDGEGGVPNPTSYGCSVVCCEEYEYGTEKLDINTYEKININHKWMNEGSCSARESLVMDEEWEWQGVGRRQVSNSYCEGEKPVSTCENGVCTNRIIPITITSEIKTTTSDTQTIPDTTSTESSTTQAENTPIVNESTEILTPKAYWADINRTVITDIVFEMAPLFMILENSEILEGEEVIFEVYETDFFVDDLIKVVVGTVDGEGNVNVDAIITETDLDKARELFEGNLDDFYFKVNGVMSGSLKIIFS